jgi:hypothetical protein
MAVVLGLAIAVLLVVAVVVGPDQASPWLRAAHVVVLWAGPLLLVLFAGVLARRKATAWARSRLIEVAGPSLIRSMSPREVLDALLPWVYGERVGHQDVLTGVLGGAGRDPRGRDTAVSRSTTANFRLWAVNDSTCRSESTWTHELSGVRANHLFVLFATCDQEIYRLVRSERLYPLFELWVVQDEDELDDLVQMSRETLRVGISYRDAHGDLYQVDPQAQFGEEIALRYYDQFVRLPDNLDRKDLRIVQFDLHDLADPDHIVERVESISVTGSGTFPADLGYFSWSPPHPCFLESVTFDVADLALPGQDLVFLVVPSSMGRGAVPLNGGWMPIRDRLCVSLSAWMLPGHGVTLLWRPVNGAEPQDASRRRGNQACP